MPVIGSKTNNHRAVRTPSLLRATVLVSAASLASRLLGLWRENLLASRFGGLGEGHLDAYYAAFRVPDFLFNIVILSAGSAIFVPLFARAVRDGDDATNETVSNVMNVCMTLLVAVTLVCYLFLPWLSDLLTPGFDGAKKAETLSLMYLMLLAPLFFGLSSILGSYLNVRKDFTSSVLSPVAYNLSLIAGILFLSPSLGVRGVAWGVVVGSALHVVVQFPALRRFRFSYRAIWHPGAAYLHSAARLTLPRLFGIGATQLNLTVDTVVAGMLASGSLTVLNWVQNMQYLPLSLIGISVSITAFTVLSDQAASGDLEAFRTTLQRNLLTVLLLIVPATVLFLVLRVPVVDLVLNYGKFAAVPENLSAASVALLAYVVSLPLQALIPLLTRAFYALQDTRTPVGAAILGVIVNVALSYLLVLRLGWGIAGLGMAFSAATLMNAGYLFVRLDGRVGLSAAGAFGTKFIRILLSGALMGLAAYGISIASAGFLPSSKSSSAIMIAVVCSVGAVAYYVSARSLGLVRGYQPQL